MSSKLILGLYSLALPLNIRDTTKRIIINNLKYY